MAKGHTQFAEDAAAEEPATTTSNTASGEAESGGNDAEHSGENGGGGGGRRPVDRVRIGMIQGAIWRNELEKGGASYQVTFERMYYDKKKDDWRYTKSFGRDELLPLAKVANECHTRILMRQKKERDAEREAEGEGSGETDGNGNGADSSESPSTAGDTGNGANRNGSAKCEPQPPPRQKATRMNSPASNAKRSRSGR